MKGGTRWSRPREIWGINNRRTRPGGRRLRAEGQGGVKPLAAKSRAVINEKEKDDAPKKPGKKAAQKNKGGSFTNYAENSLPVDLSLENKKGGGGVSCLLLF